MSIDRVVFSPLLIRFKIIFYLHSCSIFISIYKLLNYFNREKRLSVLLIRSKVYSYFLKKLSKKLELSLKWMVTQPIYCGRDIYDT